MQSQSQERFLSDFFRQWKWLVVLFIVGVLVYFPTISAGFVSDYTGFQERVTQDDSWSGALRSYGFPALQPVLNVVLYALYKFGGIYSPIYFWVYLSVHVLNAYLLYLLFRKLFFKKQIPLFQPIALTGAFLFLLHPYTVEPLVWKVCINALLSSTFILLALVAFSNYLQYDKTKHLIWVAIFQILGLLTFEYALVVPVLCLALAYWNENYLDWQKALSWIGKTLLLFSISVLYFIGVKTVTGDWAGHLGASTHLNFDFHLIIGNFIKYLFKVFLYIRFFDFNTRQLFFEKIAENEWLHYITVGLIVAWLTGILTTPLKGKIKDSSSMFLLFLGGLIPILTMYFAWMFWSENDRHIYLALLFASMLWAYLCLHVLPLKVGVPLLVLLIIINGWHQRKLVGQWCMSEEVNQNLLQDFRWYDAPEVLFLSVPNHLNGSYLYRSFHPEASEFFNILPYTVAKTPKGKATTLSEFSMNDRNDGLVAQRISTDSIHFSFAQGGNWWQRAGNGALNYETPRFRVYFNGGEARLKITDTTYHPTILYPYQMRWKEVK